MKTRLSFFVLALTSALGLGAQDLTFTGTTRAAVQVQPGVTQDIWPFSGVTQGLKLEVLTGDWLFRMTGELSADLSDLGLSRGTTEFNTVIPLGGLYRLESLGSGLADLKELYLEYTQGDLLLRGGKQIFTWGLADGNNPTDTLNPRWIGTRFASSLDDQKIAVPGVLAEYTLVDNLGKVEGILIPLGVPNVLPPVAFSSVTGSGIIGDPLVTVSLAAPQAPEFSWTGFEGGLRSLFYLDNLSFSLSWLTQLDKFFDLEVDTTTFPAFGPPTSITITQTPVYNRIHQLGADFSTTLYTWDIRTEAAFVLTEDPSGWDIYTKNSSLKAVVQASRTWFDGAVTGSLSWAPTWVFAHTWYEDYATQSDRDGAYEMSKRNAQAFQWENTLGLRMALTLLGETLKPDLLVLYNTSAKDSLVSLGTTYNLADGWNLKLGANLYTSFETDPMLKELGIFGNSSTEVKDGVYLELKWDW